MQECNIYVGIIFIYIYMKSSFPNTINPFNSLHENDIFYLDPYILLIFNLSC